MPAFDAIFAQIFGRAVQEIRVGDPLLAGIVNWMGRLQGPVFQRWAGVARSGIRCAIRVRTQEGPKACKTPAVGGCVFCQEPTCLMHAMIAANGDILCLKCVNECAQVVRERVKPRTEAPRVERAHDPADRDKYLDVLGLEDPVSVAEIKAAYRKLAKRFHPDRAKPDKRDTAQRKFVQITAAYEWLLVDQERRAA